MRTIQMNGDSMRRGRFRTLGVFLPVLVLCACSNATTAEQQQPMVEEPAATAESAMQVYYLEIVTPKVDETCAALAAQHGVTFSEPDAMLGNARTADIAGGGRIGVRAPMRDTEEPVVRPYLRVDDIEAASAEAEKAGAEFAMTATEIPGQGEFAIYFLGGIQHGIWQPD